MSNSEYNSFETEVSGKNISVFHKVFNFIRSNFSLIITITLTIYLSIYIGTLKTQLENQDGKFGIMSMQLENANQLIGSMSYQLRGLDIVQITNLYNSSNNILESFNIKYNNLLNIVNDSLSQVQIINSPKTFKRIIEITTQVADCGTGAKCTYPWIQTMLRSQFTQICNRLCTNLVSAGRKLCEDLIIYDNNCNPYMNSSDNNGQYYTATCNGASWCVDRSWVLII